MSREFGPDSPMATSDSARLCAIAGAGLRHVSGVAAATMPCSMLRRETFKSAIEISQGQRDESQDHQMTSEQRRCQAAEEGELALQAWLDNRFTAPCIVPVWVRPCSIDTQ